MRQSSKALNQRKQISIHCLVGRPEWSDITALLGAPITIITSYMIQREKHQAFLVWTLDGVNLVWIITASFDTGRAAALAVNNRRLLHLCQISMDALSIVKCSRVIFL